MNKFMIVLGLAASLAASGCVSSILETNPPKPRYTVGAVPGETLAGPDVDWSLVIENPNATRAYDTTKLAVTRSAGRIEYFGDGEWAGRAPRIFLTTLIESFEDSGRIVAVGDRVALPLADYALQTDVRRIDLDVSGAAPQARLSVYARLGDGRSKIYAARSFSASVRAQSLSGDDVAAAFDSVFKQVIADIVSWSFEQGETMETQDAGA